MQPLVVLLSAFLIALLAGRIIRKQWLLTFTGCLAMSVMLAFTAVGHFMYPEGMALMLPDFIPFKTGIIYITGIVEIAAAVGLMILRFRRLTAWLLIIFFILILPANIHAAIQHVNLETAGYDGKGPSFLWFRVPLQLIFIVWVYYFCLYRK